MSETMPNDRQGVQSNSPNIINLSSVANDIMLEDVEKWLRRKIKSDEAQKCLHSDVDRGAKELQASAATFANTHLKARTPLRPDNVLVSTSVESLLDTLAFDIDNEGDTIIVPSTFAYNLKPRNGIEIVYVSCENSFGDECTASLDDNGPCKVISRIKDAIKQTNETGRKVATILTTNPLHAVKECRCRSELGELASLAFITGARLIVDESNVLSSGPAFNSVLSLNLERSISENIHILWGLSKDFGLSDLRTGFLFTYARNIYESVSACSTLTKESSFNSLVGSRLLSDTKFISQFRTKYHKHLERNLERTEKFLRSHEIPYIASPEAGSILLIDLSEWMWYFRNGEDSAESNLTKFLMNRNVSLNAEITCYPRRSGTFQLNYGIKAADVGLKRLVEALGELDGTTKMIEYDYRCLRETSKKSNVLQLH